MDPESRDWKDKTVLPTEGSRTSEQVWRQESCWLKLMKVKDGRHDFHQLSQREAKYETPKLKNKRKTWR